MYKRIAAVLAISLAVLVGVKLVSAQDTTSGTTRTIPVQPAGLPAGPAVISYNNSPGVPAIQPVRVAASQSSAAYGEAEVVKYLDAHPYFKPATPAAGKVARVLFIPAAQVSAMLHGGSIGRPDTTIVCYVEVQGPLTPEVDLPPYPGGTTPSGPLKPAPLGVLVFDAQTGNLLMQTYTGY